MKFDILNNKTYWHNILWICHFIFSFSTSSNQRVKTLRIRIEVNPRSDNRTPPFWRSWDLLIGRSTSLLTFDLTWSPWLGLINFRYHTLPLFQCQVKIHATYKPISKIRKSRHLFDLSCWIWVHTSWRTLCFLWK